MHRDGLALKNDVWDMHNLLLHISERYPHYTFLTECRLEDDGMMRATEIAVFSGEEPLGRLETHYEQGIIFHNNRRLREVTERERLS